MRNGRHRIIAAALMLGATSLFLLMGETELRSWDGIAWNTFARLRGSWRADISDSLGNRVDRAWGNQDSRNPTTVLIGDPTGGSISDPSRAYINIDDDGDWDAFPGLCLVDERTLLVVYRKGTTHASDKGSIVSRISRDLGQTWSDEAVVYADSTYDSRDPCVTKLSDGTIIMNFFLSDYTTGDVPEDGVRIMKSADGGSTWTDPITVDAGFTDWCASSGPIVELSDGTLLLPVYGQDTGDSLDSSRLLKSTDGGTTWGDEAVIATSIFGHVQEPNIVDLGDSLIAMLRYYDEPDGYIAAVWSGDGGDTWGDFALLFRGRGRPSTIKVSSGKLLCVYRGEPGYGNSRICYRTSNNNGHHWSYDSREYVLEDLPGMEYASMAEVAPGIVAVAYGNYDHQIRLRYLCDGGGITPTGGVMGIGVTSYGSNVTVIDGGFSMRRMRLASEALAIDLQDDQPYIKLRANNGDWYKITVNTSDQALFSGATGGYDFDGTLTADDPRMPTTKQGSPGEGSFCLGESDTLWVYSGGAWKYTVLSTP